jgi:putative ABC transport system permease protein
VLLTSCLAAAFPRAVDRYEDRAVRQALAQEPAARSVLSVTTSDASARLATGDADDLLGDAPSRRAGQRIAASLKAPFTVDRAESSYGLRTDPPAAAHDRWLPLPDGEPTQFTVVAQGDLAGHAKVTAGRLPRKGDSPDRLEAAVTADTARRLHAKVGSVVHLPGLTGGSVTVRITGILAPHHPSGAYWSANPLLRTAELRTTDSMPPARYWLAALLTDPEAAPQLSQAFGSVEQYWQIAPAAGSLTAHQLPALKSALAYTTNGPGLVPVRQAARSDTSDVSSGLTELVDRFEQTRAQITPVVAVAVYGAGAVACIVLLMSSGLTADRRRGELALLRSRGASLPGLARRLFAETAVVTVPAGALGLWLALLAVPYGRWLQATLAAAAVTALACGILPVRAALAHRRARLGEDRDDLAEARPTARRTVVELTVLVLAAAAVVALRRRGATDGGDSLVALAPVLVGVVAAFLLSRVYPLLLRGAVRPMTRLRGVVGPLAMARAARSGAGTAGFVLPLLALLTALTTAAFGGSVLAGIAGTRDHAALVATGADARVDASGALSAAAVSRVRAVPGVTAVSAASVRYDAEVLDGVRRLPLAAVDPDSYARLARHTGLGAFDAGLLKPHGTTLPALVSPSLAELFTGGRLQLFLHGEVVTLRIAATPAATPALSDDFLVVDGAALAHLTGERRATGTLLLTGSGIPGDRLRAAAGSGTRVQVRSEERAGFADSPLQRGATGVYTAAVAAGAGFAVLALVLALARAAPERLALLARLRTLGLTRRQGRRLLILEALPQAVLAAAGGALTGWATVLLLAPGLDLTALALADTPTDAPARLTTDAFSLGVPALCVLAGTVGVAALQAWWAGRRGSVKELRAGESA